MNLWLTHLQLDPVIQRCAFGLTLPLGLIACLALIYTIEPKLTKHPNKYTRWCYGSLVLVSCLLFAACISLLIGSSNTNQIINRTKVTVPVETSRSFSDNKGTFVFAKSKFGTMKIAAPNSDNTEYRVANKVHPAGSKQLFLTVYLPDQRLNKLDQQRAKQSAFHEEPKITIVKYLKVK